MGSPRAAASTAAVLPGTVVAGRIAAATPAEPPLAIEVDRLGVEYPLRLSRKRTIRRGFASLLRRRNGPKRFWALRELSLEVRRGEVLAVIGPNGAGKTTLLQALAGIIQPSEGTVTVRGAVTSVLGTGGFDPELSGRENIGLFGALLGVPAPAMRERMDAIIDVAGIGDFIDAPLRTYSQGMRARLGLSIASVIEPDVLLLDEIVATADEEHRARSEARFRDLARRARAIVVVTHDVRWVAEFCSRAVLVEHGRLIADGAPADLLERYREPAAAGDGSAAPRRRRPV